MRSDLQKAETLRNVLFNGLPGISERPDRRTCRHTTEVAPDPSRADITCPPKRGGHNGAQEPEHSSGSSCLALCVKPTERNTALSRRGSSFCGFMHGKVSDTKPEKLFGVRRLDAALST
jgi:hypothetical protein